MIVYCFLIYEISMFDHFFFFFSSRRRHTRCSRDWSSDVCSSDLQLKDQLGDFEDCDELSGRKRKFCDAGLPANLTQVLEAAAPVYRSRLWLEHDQANRRWILQVAPLVREQGVGLSERLADIYQTRWPHEKIRVDVVAYANWACAYTTVDPLRVTISSLDTRNQWPQGI